MTEMNKCSHLKNVLRLYILMLALKNICHSKISKTILKESCCVKLC